MKKKKGIFSRLFSKKKNDDRIRKVYFGLRIRFLTLLTLVMVIIIGLISLILYFHQSHILEVEKKVNTETLTKILRGPAEFYLDRDKETTDKEYRLKFNVIQKEAANFMTYNKDIEKIYLVNHRGRIQYPRSGEFYKWRKNPKLVPGYIMQGLKQEENKLKSTSFTKDIYNKKTKKKEPRSYIAITSPIFLNSGDTVDILKQYSNLYKEYHESKKKQEQVQIINKLTSEFKDELGEKFDRTAIEKEKSEKEQEVNNKNKIERYNDIDFIFHRLFVHVYQSRKRHFGKKNWRFYNDKWLYNLKASYNRAKENDLLSKQNEIRQKIIDNIDVMAQKVEKSRRLGVLAIVFNVDERKNELQKIISKIVIPLPLMPWQKEGEASKNVEITVTTFIISIFVIIALAFLIVLNFMIRNLKKLQAWAIGVAKGNLENKIEIKANDEIGRLGDVFNYMLDEIIMKFHLEKFVSTSAKSMINKSRTKTTSVDLGVTGRKNFAFIFSDVRGFTSFSEKNDPDTVIQVLNYYLELQSDIIKKAKGDIDDYVGDEIMSHYGGEKRADTAIETAIKIMKAVKKANTERNKKGLPVFEVGIGIHGGEVVVGNVGSKFRMDFACVGDAVNLTSRLCSAAGPGEIIVSKELLGQTTKKFGYVNVPSLTLKGKAKKISVVRIKV